MTVTAVSPPSSSLPGFLHIGPRTSLYTPSPAVPGQLIIICTWLGASKKVIAKYVALYQLIAPGAKILLIESNVPILVSSYARQRRHILPAVNAVVGTLIECGYYDIGNTDYLPDVGLSSSDDEPLLNISSSSNSSQTADSDGSLLFLTGHTENMASTKKIQPRILLHTFSNGGTNTATQLLITLHETQMRDLDSTSSSLPLRGIILDSCPAKGTYMKSYNAMVFSLPKGAINKLVGAIAVHFLLTLLYAWIAAGNENPASLMRRTIIDPEIVTGDAKESKGNDEKTELNDNEEATAHEKGSAVYIYSKEDKMVEFTDISDHAEEARRQGWRVEEEVFEGSAHCAHLSKDSRRYAEAIERVWRGDIGKKRDQNQIRTKL